MDIGKKTLWVVEFVFQLLLLVFFTTLFFMALPMSRMSGLMPRLVCGFGSILSFFQIVVTIFRYKRARAGFKTGFFDEVEEQQMKGLGLFSSVLLALAYIICFYFLGFLIASFLALAFIPILVGYKRWSVCLMYSALLSSTLYVVFVRFFYVRLPGGLLWEHLM